MTITLEVDSDDARDIHAAIARWQSCARYDGGGVILPQGASDIRGAILGIICRGWLDSIDGPQEEAEDFED